MKSYQQAADHGCGTAVVRDLLNHFGMPVPSERSLLRKLKATFKDGIDPQEIIMYFASLGLRARIHTHGSLTALKNCLKRGVTPIIIWLDWGGHYVIVSGYDEPKGWSGGRFKLIDPAASYEGRTHGCTQVAGDRLKSMWRGIHGDPQLYITVEK